jgi:hypothetical protein
VQGEGFGSKTLSRGWVRRAVCVVTHRTHASGTSDADLLRRFPEGGLRDKAANPPYGIYKWSSAGAHCGLKKDAVLTTDREWQAQFNVVGDWSEWLAAGDRPEQLEVLRRHVERGLPCGAEGFLCRLEQRAGQLLRPRARGRQKKSVHTD